MAITVAGSATTENRENDEGGGDIDEDDYTQQMKKLFGGLREKIESLPNKVNKIENALVTNIRSDINIVGELVEVFCTQKYMIEYVEKKVKCIGEEVDGVIEYLESKRKAKEAAAAEENEAAADKRKDDDGRRLIKTSEWLYSIAKKTEKIKKLVSQFGSLPDEDDATVSPATAKSREKQKTVSNSMECHNMYIEESLLISPMAASLKKSYDHLPTNELRMCLLSLAAFPEDFIVKKRPLIYWWMAEGFVVMMEKKSAEEVGHENFTQLIQLGLIQPWYESGNTNQQHVQGCRVHPWIRRMLVSIAMEAQLLEFFGIPPGNNSQSHRSPRVCLYDDGEEGVVEDTGAWNTKNRKYDKYRQRLKWNVTVKFNALIRYRDQENKKAGQPKEEDNLKALSDRQMKLKFVTDLNALLAAVTHEKIKPWIDQDALAAFIKKRSDLEDKIDALKKTTNDLEDNVILLKQLHDEQMELLNDIDEGFEQQVRDQINYLERVLDPAVYKRSNNCDILQKNELLFRHNDLNNPFPFPMKKQSNNYGRSNADHKNEQAKKSDVTNNANEAAAERLLAIINVTQKYLYMEHEAFGKMKNLRTLHLGRWRDSLPVPHIEVENARIFEALFHVAKHLKYLSLRGISRITELPSTISKCCNLQILDLKACYNLETLPSEIASLYNLTHFDVSECYLLQNTNLWSLVQHLQFLQTLKGLKIDQFTHYSLQTLAGSLRKLSIILTTPTFDINRLASLSQLRILTITWRITTSEKPKPGTSTENPPEKQPENTNDNNGGTTETTPHPNPEKSDDGEAKTESTQQKKPGKSDDEGDANTESTQQKKPGKSDDGEVKGIEAQLPDGLKKLDLRCYPDKDWPNWVKKHSSLETLYITGGDLEEFPMAELNLPTLQVMRFKYLTKLKLDEDNTPLKSPKFPSLISFRNHNIKSKK